MTLNKFLIILGVLLSFFLLILFYSTSLSCGYHIKITTPTETWDGVCQLGKSSWIEKSGDSEWHVNAWSFAIGHQLFFIAPQRNLVYKIGKVNNSLDNFNTQAGGNIILSYSLQHLPNNQLAFFHSFPTEGVVIGTFSGNLSLLSSLTFKHDYNMRFVNDKIDY